MNCTMFGASLLNTVASVVMIFIKEIFDICFSYSLVYLEKELDFVILSVV